MILQFILCVKCTDHYFLFYLQMYCFCIVCFCSRLSNRCSMSEPLAGWLESYMLIEK